MKVLKKLQYLHQGYDKASSLYHIPVYTDVDLLFKFSVLDFGATLLQIKNNKI